MEKKKNSSAKKTRKEKVEKEKVCEIFEVEKDGKEKEIKTCGIEEEKNPSKEQLEKEKKIFIGVGIAMLCFILMFAAVYFIIYLTNHFEVGGVNFEIDKTDLQGQTIYKTSIPGTIYNGTFILGGTIGTRADYNFYFRTDPRILEKDISFDGVLNIEGNMVLNMTQDFNCDGKGIIAIANLLNVYKAIGTKVIKDENATCDPNGRYIFLKIQEGNQTSINQFGPTCYDINVNNCEILPATERYLLETLIDVNQKVK